MSKLFRTWDCEVAVNDSHFGYELGWLYCAVLCYARLCYAMPCYATLCYAMLCYAMLCYAVLHYALLWYAGLWNVLLCSGTFFYFFCNAMMRCAMPRENSTQSSEKTRYKFLWKFRCLFPTEIDQKLPKRPFTWGFHAVWCACVV